jgi:anionic cell wall polymer biosynthesis LytR-Cps2A-Psr (LCP) family protein
MWTEVTAMPDPKTAKYRYFVLSFLLSFVLLSVLLYGLMRVARPGAGRALAREPGAVPATAYLPTREDALSVLFVGLDPAGGADTFLLARFNPAGGSVPIAALPRETAILNHGKTETIAEVYRYGGADYLRARMTESLGVTIDRYVRMDGGAFVAAADAVGAVEFELPAALTTGAEGGMPVTLSAGMQLLDGAAAARIIQFSGYEGGEPARCAMVAELAAEAVNQRMDIVLSALMDNVFRTIVNLVDTDISYADYDDRKQAAAFLAKLGQEPAKPLPLVGGYNEDETIYTLSDTFVAELRQEFAG